MKAVLRHEQNVETLTIKILCYIKQRNHLLILCYPYRAFFNIQYVNQQIQLIKYNKKVHYKTIHHKFIL